MKLVKDFFKENRLLICGFLVLFLATIVGQQLFQNAPAPPAPKSIDSVDTFIPRGFILVPLELANASQLSALLGDAGIIDLYSAPDEGKRPMKIASRIKLIRAPLNPEVYAALVREDEGHRILSYRGPYSASVQNPEEQAGGIIETAKAQAPRFEYQQ